MQSHLLEQRSYNCSNDCFYGILRDATIDKCVVFPNYGKRLTVHMMVPMCANKSVEVSRRKRIMSGFEA